MLLVHLDPSIPAVFDFLLNLLIKPTVRRGSDIISVIMVHVNINVLLATVFLDSNYERQCFVMS